MTMTIDGSNGFSLDGQFNSASSFGFKNRIINGAMMIDQRNAGASTTPTTSGTYNLDRWRIAISQASKFSVQQNAGSVTPPAGFTNYLGVTSSAATSIGASDYYTISQSIEGYNIADLAWGTASASTITISFWVRSSITGTLGGALQNNGANRCYPFTYSINSANTWEQKTVTIAGDTTGTWLTTNGTGVSVFFNLGTGSTYSGTAGTWSGTTYIAPTGATSVVGTSGATFYITGVQLEKGSTATSFDYRPYGTELQLCQRYYQVVRATWSGNSTSGENYVTPVIFQQTMRASPTGTSTDVVNLGFNTGGSFRDLATAGASFVAVCNATNTGRFYTRDCAMSAEL